MTLTYERVRCELDDCMSVSSDCVVVQASDSSNSSVERIVLNRSSGI